MSLVGEWHFTAPDGQRDRCNHFEDLQLHGFSGLGRRGLELGHGSWAIANYARGPVITKKTLVVWVRLSRVESSQQAGSVISIAGRDICNDRFDGLAFSDGTAYAWMAASDWNHRTIVKSDGQEARAGSFGRLLKMAVSYDTQRVRDASGVTTTQAWIRVYRQPILDGQKLGELTCISEHVLGTPETFAPNQSVVHFGGRYFRMLGDAPYPIGHVNGTLAAAQVYNEALAPAAIAALAPPVTRAGATETFALLLGVQDYQFLDRAAGRSLGTTDLHGTLNDIRSYAALTRLMGVPASHVKVLSNPKLGPNDFTSVVLGRERPVDMNMVEASFGYATQAGILQGLQWLANQLRAHPDAQGLLFFAGHSVTTSQGHPALAPLDAQRPARRTTQPKLPFAGDVSTWRKVAGLAQDLAAILGTREPAVISDFFGRCFRFDDGVYVGDNKYERVRRVSPDSLHDALVAKGLDVDDPQRRSLIRGMALGAENDVRPGDVEWSCFHRIFEGAERAGFSPEQVAQYLSTDPFAGDESLEGLISYVHALDIALRPLPEDRSVTVVLETCLPGTNLNRAYTGEDKLPRAHAGITIIASCAMGTNSYSGVFDNAWHGAFTWAVTSLLSQWDVVVSNAGRYFREDHERLLSGTTTLMSALGFTEQTPQVWSNPEARSGPVFGRREWQEQTTAVEVLRRVKVKEEIDPDSDGHIFEIRENTTLRGWLVVPATSFTVNKSGWTGGTYSWTANTEYWIWTQSQSGLPQVTLRLIRPGTTPSANPPTLADWIAANVTTIDYVRSSASATFGQDDPQNGKSFSGCHVARRLWDSKDLAVLETSGSTVTWSRIQSSPLTGGRLMFMPSGQIVLESGSEVGLLWNSGTITRDVIDKKVVDNL